MYMYIIREAPTSCLINCTWQIVQYTVHDKFFILRLLSNSKKILGLIVDGILKLTVENIL